MMQDAIKDYHDLLASMSRGELEEMNANFKQALVEKKSHYGGRLLTQYLRPKFLTKDQMKTIRQVCSTLRNIVVKVKDAYFEDRHISEDVGLTEGERMLANIDPGFSRVSITARWDSFWGEEGLKFVELNAESPAGVAYTDNMTEVYLDLPVMREFMKSYRVERFYVREVLLDALLATYQIWSGNKSGRIVPNIAIVDWREVPTYSEFELLQDYFEFHGVPTIIADPRELTYHKGRLRKEDFEIDLVYRRVLTQEFLQKFDEVQPMFKAYQDRNVCAINSFRAKMVHKKSLFAILSDTRNKNYFTAAELKVIGEHIPWTRVVRDTKTDFKGKQINLLDYISQNKENFVLKPNDEYGGKGVVIGWETSTEEWQKRLLEALTEMYVVQEKVPLARELYPYYDGEVKFHELLVDLDPYLFGVNTAGVLTRLSASSLANVTAGGGSTVTVIIEKK
jgi:hypothetical protein